MILLRYSNILAKCLSLKSMRGGVVQAEQLNVKSDEYPVLKESRSRDSRPRSAL
jgi:hypothetical protein